MKKLAVILSLVVFVLSIAPCCALDDHFRQAEASKTFKTNSNTQSEDCCLDCSPFYTCGTCGGFMISSLTGFTAPPPTLLAAAFNPNHLQAFAEGVAQNIWQPPKLS
ncbi:MAG: hypothetical protein EOO10_23860 [Chitinophagaceae bacterium]|nr:MAG: hypothetical protein EOO10_23860 [Chitinophagaceae bacterium]